MRSRLLFQHRKRQVIAVALRLPNLGLPHGGQSCAIPAARTARLSSDCGAPRQSGKRMSDNALSEGGSYGVQRAFAASSSRPPAHWPELLPMLAV
jgi:hypothetical protein